MKKNIITILLAVSIIGCNDTNKVEELRLKIEDKKLNTISNVPDFPEIKVFDSYNYKSSSMKSPFKKSVSVLKIEKKVFTNVNPDLKREKTKLESYDLPLLKMIGTLKIKNNEIESIIEAPDGVVYSLRIGDYIGKNYGVVKQIEENQIMLEEIIPNGSFNWQKRPATITMSKKD